MAAPSARRTPSLERSRPIWAQAYDILRNRIATLELAPGTNLSESEIAEELSISRTPVREAFIRLSEEGFVDIYPQYGTFVSPIRIADVLHAQFVRVSIECAIVKELASSITAATIADIRRLIQLQKGAVRTGDITRFYELDEAMHQAMSVGREAVWRFVGPAKMHVGRVRHLLLPKEIGVRGLVGEHERILAGLEAKDPVEAEAMMRQHLDGLLAGLDDLQRRHPSFFETTTGERPARAAKGSS